MVGWATRLRWALVVLALAGACSSATDVEVGRDGVPATDTAPGGSSTVPQAATTATSADAPLVVPPLPGDGTVRAVTTPTGVVATVTERQDDRYLIRTPCDNRALVDAVETHTGAHVVLDAGHGGVEPGAVGPGGLTEKEVNLSVAEIAADHLRDRGFTVVLTRTADYRIPLAQRTRIATALQALAFVSIHHNAEPDGPFEGPGSETYHQIADPESKRLAGLIYEETVEALSEFDAQWVGDTDAGAKYRPNSSGGDYYGILRLSAGVPAVLAELSFIANPSEEALLREQAFIEAEALAVARGVIRFLTTDDPGSGFTEPYPRDAPAGSGGGSTNCEDPPLT